MRLLWGQDGNHRVVRGIVSLAAGKATPGAARQKPAATIKRFERSCYRCFVIGSMVESPPHTTRWVVRRKAAIVAAVCSGAITLEEACRHYRLTEEEFLAWQRASDSEGLPGLRATRPPAYRNRLAPPPKPRG